MKIKEIKNKDLGNYHIIEKDFGYKFKQITMPTNNCQMDFLSNVGDLVSIFITDEERLQIMRHLHKCGSKATLIDIKKRDYENLIKCFGKDCIISKTPYTSTNRSEMIIILINTEKAIAHINIISNTSKI